MANLKNNLDKNDIPTSYYLFKPDILLKVIGEHTYIYNTILHEWTNTKPFSDYVQSGAAFKALNEELANRVINEYNERILIKKEITDSDIEKMLAGKKKIVNEDSSDIREEILPEAFIEEENDNENIKIKGLNVRKNSFYEKAFFPLVIVIILLLSYILLRNS